MAEKSTIFKANLQVADMDRAYYQEHALVLARHPSETNERLMVRILAFALNAHERLAFGRGLSAEDEADLFLNDLTGAPLLWIDVGLPDERLIRKACNRAERVVVYCYGGRTADVWIKQNLGALGKYRNLTVINLSQESTKALVELVQPSMKLHCTIQDGQVWLSNGEQSVQVEQQAVLR
ncbi:MAG: YaeQ family protein [Betaproteobacteria bacterium]|nr:YaeQ family protein [Betaproteobacteria bacterium]